jgi:ATP/maltotriose-dependent transcriptional regulator MalT
VAELRRRGMSEAKAKAAAADNLRAVREAGIDPDIPPEFLHRLSLAACTWYFSRGEAAAFAAALAAGDDAAVARMLLRKRRLAERGQDALVDAVRRALRPGEVPALGAR